MSQEQSPPPPPLGEGGDSLYPSAKAEPELGGTGGGRGGTMDDDDVVATVEMTDMTPIHELKLEPTTTTTITSLDPQILKFDPTLVPLPPPSQTQQQQQQQQQQSFGTIPGNHLMLPPSSTTTTTTTSQFPQEKQGSKCCGCCCDYRRAVIIVNSFFLGFAVFSMLVQNAGPDLVAETFSNDDVFVEEVTIVLDDYFLKRVIFLGISLLTAVMAIVGAVHFRVYMIGLHVIWLLIDYVAYIILGMKLIEELEPLYGQHDLEPASPLPNFVFFGMMMVLFIYPHLELIREIQNGIMSMETYPREEFSCCCMDKRRQRQRPLPTPLPSVQAQPYPTN